MSNFEVEYKEILPTKAFRDLAESYYHLLPHEPGLEAYASDQSSSDFKIIREAKEAFDATRDAHREVTGTDFGSMTPIIFSASEIVEASYGYMISRNISSKSKLTVIIRQILVGVPFIPGTKSPAPLEPAIWLKTELPSTPLDLHHIFVAAHRATFYEPTMT
jgi:hypothetical protein